MVERLIKKALSMLLLISMASAAVLILLVFPLQRERYESKGTFPLPGGLLLFRSPDTTIVPLVPSEITHIGWNQRFIVAQVEEWPVRQRRNEQVSDARYYVVDISEYCVYHCQNKNTLTAFQNKMSGKFQIGNLHTIENANRIRSKEMGIEWNSVNFQKYWRTMKTLQKASGLITGYAISKGKYPDTLLEIEHFFHDAWGRSLNYEVGDDFKDFPATYYPNDLPAGGYKLWSPGFPSGIVITASGEMKYGVKTPYSRFEVDENGTAFPRSNPVWPSNGTDRGGE